MGRVATELPQSCHRVSPTDRPPPNLPPRFPDFGRSESVGFVIGSSADWVPLLPVCPRLAHGRVSPCYPCVAMHSLATAMKRTERISSATAWRSVAMPARNGLARARRRYWVGLRALLWCIGIRALVRPWHWGRSAVWSGALFASRPLLFPHHGTRLREGDAPRVSMRKARRCRRRVG